jgi:WD40 repeat protein
MIRRCRCPFRLALLVVGLVASRALGQETQDAKKVQDLSFYRAFLEQAENALKQKDGAANARQILDLCPKEQRCFEWHFVSAKVSRAPRTFKHERLVRAAAFSPDGKTLASGDDDGNVKMWNLAGSANVPSFKGHDDSVSGLAFHAKDKMLASAGSDKKVKLWDTVTRKSIATFPHKEAIEGIDFSPDGKWLAWFDWQGAVHVLDVKKRQVKAIWTAEDDAGKRADCLAFSADGRFLVFGARASLRLVTVPDFQLVKTTVGHQSVVRGLAFHTDSKRLISVGLDGIRIWQLPELKLLQSLTDPEDAPSIAVACNRQGALATFGGSKVRVWYEPFHKPAQYFDARGGNLIGIAFSPNGQYLAVGADRISLRVYDLTEEIEVVRAPQPVWSVQPANGLLLVSMRRGAAALTSDGRPRPLDGHAGQVRAVVRQPQGFLLASAGSDRVVKVWDAAGTRVIHNLTGHQQMIRALAFSPGGKHLASGSEDKTVKIWDAVAGREVRTLKGHKGIVTSVVFFPGGELLASAGGEGTVRIWNLATGKVLRTLEAHEDIASHLALSPDGTRLASAGTDRRIRIWEVKTGRPLHDLPGQTSMVQGLAFSPDGKRLASGSMNAVTLWDPEVGQHVYTFSRPAGPVNAIAFSPDGTALYSGSYDGSVMQWRARPAD